MGSMYLPTTRRSSSSLNNIVEEFIKKRYREMLNKEDEQEEEYLQSRQVKTRTFAELAAELPRLMMNMSLPCGQVQREQDAAAIHNYTSKRKLTNSHEDEEQEVKRRKTLEQLGKKIEALRITTTKEEYGKSYNRDFSNLPSDILLLILDKLLEPIDHARFAVVSKEWQSLAKEYNCETKPWLRVLTPMLLIPTHSHGSHDPTTMLYSVSERTFYRNIKLPVPGDDTIYCGFGWMAKLRYPNKSLDGSLAITLTNPFRDSNDVIHLPPISPIWFSSAMPEVKIILPSDPTLDRNNYVVLAICDSSRLLLIGGGQKHWICPMSDRCSTATYYEGRVFSVIDFGRSTDLFVTFLHGSNYSKLHVAWLGHLDDKLRLVQTYLVTSTKGDLLVVKRLLEGRKLRFKVFKWVESIALLAKVDSIGDEAIFVGSNQSVCVSASKFPGYKSNSIYFTNDVVVGGQRLEDIGIYNLEDGTITHYPHNQFVEGNKVQAIWITPAFAEC
ncbi:hypothetical protein ACLB2K_005306 [Fragaria x ananassa]